MHVLVGEPEKLRCLLRSCLELRISDLRQVNETRVMTETGISNFDVRIEP